MPAEREAIHQPCSSGVGTLVMRPSARGRAAHDGTARRRAPIALHAGRPRRTRSPPWRASTSRAPAGPREQRGLRQRLRLDGGRRERGDGDQAGERRLAGRGVEQVMAHRAVRAAPDARRAARRSRRRRRASVKPSTRSPRERVLDVDPARGSGVAADAQVAAAVDGPVGVAVEQRGAEVGGVALAGAARVEPQAGRARDRPGPVVDRDLAPARRAGSADAARRGTSSVARARRAGRVAACGPRTRGSRRRRGRRAASGRRGRRSSSAACERRADRAAQQVGRRHDRAAGRRSARTARSPA